MFCLSRFVSLVCLAAMAAGNACAAEYNPGVSRTQATLAQLPLRFEANQGRMDPSVYFAARAAGYTLLLSAQGPAMSFSDGTRIDVAMPGSSRASKIEGLSALATRTDSFIGGREHWRTSIPAYSRVRYQ